MALEWVSFALAIFVVGQAQLAHHVAWLDPIADGNGATVSGKLD